VRACEHCGGELATTRPNAFFCSGRCRSRASRRYRAKLPADAYPAGARRGRVPLGELTIAEHEADLLVPTPARV
jgi:hypothetical protein